MPPNMIGTYLEENMPNPYRGDCFVMKEWNTHVYRLHHLKPEEKVVADLVIQEASLALGRPLPPRYVDALYRKYQKVKNSNTTYGFGVLAENRKELKGTQGWSVQMALQLKKKVYVYDEKTRQWYKGDRFEAQLPEDEATVELSRFKPCDPLSLDQKSNISLPVSINPVLQDELQKPLARRS